MILIQQVFVEEDPSALLEPFQMKLRDVTSPHSGIPTPSYIGLMLKYFVANLAQRVGDG